MKMTDNGWWPSTKRLFKRRIQPFMRHGMTLSILAGATIALAAPAPQSSADAAFAADMSASMSRMMAAMNIRSSGNVDMDFASMMIPHHQGAIDMAIAELRYGKNEQLKRIAQGIVVEQNQEIAAMRAALGRSASPNSTGADDRQHLHHGKQ